MVERKMVRRVYLQAPNILQIHVQDEHTESNHHQTHKSYRTYPVHINICLHLYITLCTLDNTRGLDEPYCDIVYEHEHGARGSWYMEQYAYLL